MTWIGSISCRRRAVVAVVHLAQLGDELLLALLRIPHAEVGEPLRQRLDVLGRSVDEEPRQLRHVVVGQLAGEPEVDEADPVGREHEDVRRMRVAVEEPVPEDHRHPRLGDQVRELAALLERPLLERRGRRAARRRAPRA